MPLTKTTPETEVISVSNFSLPDEEEEEEDDDDMDDAGGDLESPEFRHHLGSEVLLRGMERRSHSRPTSGNSTDSAEERRQGIAENVLCPICTEILIDPVCTPCGHCFCRICLDRHLIRTHENACPIDQEPLPDYLAVCAQLKTLVELLYPSETRARAGLLREAERNIWERLEEIVASHKQPQQRPKPWLKTTNGPKQASSTANLLHLLDFPGVRAPGSSMPPLERVSGDLVDCGKGGRDSDNSEDDH